MSEQMHLFFDVLKTCFLKTDKIILLGERKEDELGKKSQQNLL